MEAEAAVVPGQTAIIDQPPGLTFEVVDHLLVRDVEHTSRRKNGSPVSHHFRIPAVVTPQLRQIIAELVAHTE